MNEESVPCPECIEKGMYVLMLPWRDEIWVYKCDECETMYDKNLGVLGKE